MRKPVLNRRESGYDAKSGRWHIHLGKDKFAFVDRADFLKLRGYNWYAIERRRTWYAARGVRGGVGSWIGRNTKLELMHRRITNAPAGMQVDHANRNGLDNRRDNLRLATHSDNNGNRCKFGTCLSLYKGVSWCKDVSRWRAYIGAKRTGKDRVHLGLFVSEKDAAKTYDTAARKYFGVYARLNFPRRGERGCL